MPKKPRVGKGGIDEVPEECREEKGLFPRPLEEGLWRLYLREEGKPCQPCVVTKSGPCGQQGRGGPVGRRSLIGGRNTKYMYTQNVLNKS